MTEAAAIALARAADAASSSASLDELRLPWCGIDSQSTFRLASRVASLGCR